MRHLSFKSKLAALALVMFSGVALAQFAGAVLDAPVITGHLQVALRPAVQPPTVATCGTAPALQQGSTDLAGKITVGTSASNACTLTFAQAGTNATTPPFCVYQNMTTGAGVNIATVTNTGIVWSSALADSTLLVYHCIFAAGG